MMALQHRLDRETARAFTGTFETLLEGEMCYLELFTTTTGVLRGWLNTRGCIFSVQGHMASQGKLCGVLLEADTTLVALFTLHLEENQLRLELDMPEQDGLNPSLYEPKPHWAKARN
jgi:hypothetical protein